ncbi:MAG TPA: hypothetical protein VFB15_14125 [Candidatus Binataceae bacterium]|jgi:hypothetical protein|nr:hypothetical protein [Candidatus Binataceae bacterium]
MASIRCEAVLRAVSLAAVIGLLGACSTPGKTTMQVNVTQLGNYDNPARAPDCDMPVLDTMPLSEGYKQIAIVEAWADSSDTMPDVLPALKRRACETGADALVILNSQHQDIKNSLYQAGPNETENETTEHNTYATQGDYIKEAEHTRLIGEEGHNGYYVDAIAIDYTVTDPKQSSKIAPAYRSSPNS